MREGPSEQYLIPFEGRAEPLSYEDYLEAYWGTQGYLDLLGMCNARLVSIDMEYPKNGPTK